MEELNMLFERFKEFLTTQWRLTSFSVAVSFITVLVSGASMWGFIFASIIIVLILFVLFLLGIEFI